MGSLGASGLHRLAQALRVGAARRFDRASLSPGAAQEAYLRNLLRMGATTLFGQAHGFSEITSPGQFVKRVPFMTAPELARWASRAQAGERQLLTPERPVLYAVTAGVCGEPKRIPVTPTYRSELRRAAQTSLFHLYRRFPEAFRSSVLHLFGGARLAQGTERSEPRMLQGVDSVAIPRLLQGLEGWPPQLAEVQDPRTRSALALMLASVANPSALFALFPLSLVLLLRDLSERADELSRCVRKGILPPGARLLPRQEAFFQKWLGTPRRDVAKRLERAAGAPVEAKAQEAWPALKLVSAWTGGAASVFIPELKRRLGPRVAVRDGIYSACEGFFSIPMGEEEPGGALPVDSHYFEFIEEGELGRGSRDVLPVDAVKEGGRYQLAISNGAGLYRYLVGDLVEVYGRYRGVPLVRFVQRSGAVCSIAGERLEEGAVARAMALALPAQGVEVTWLTLAPDASAPRYVLYAELPLGTEAAVGERLAAALEEALCREAPEYARLRSAGQLVPLRLVRLAAGACERRRRRQMEAGCAEGQAKVSALEPDRSRLPAELLKAEELAQAS